MLPDWVLLILLFIGIAIVPMYDQARMLTPFEYLAGGLGTLFQSLGAFVGLILLAVVLIVVGGALLFGVEHVKELLGKRTGHAGTTDIATATTAGSDGPTSSHHMRPYRVAKEKGVPRDDRLYGLIFVIAGLGLLWLIPTLVLKDKPETYQPPPSFSNTPPYSRKFSLADSTPGQAVLGVMTLVVLLATFALLGPEKQTKKATEKVASTRSAR